MFQYEETVISKGEQSYHLFKFLQCHCNVYNNNYSRHKCLQGPIERSIKLLDGFGAWVPPGRLVHDITSVAKSNIVAATTETGSLAHSSGHSVESTYWGRWNVRMMIIFV